MDYAIACLNLEVGEKCDICSVGLWNDLTIRLLELPSLNQLRKEVIGGGISVI
jgi:hypothetical protein